GPNKGSPVADFVYNLTQSPIAPILDPGVSSAVNVFFSLVGIGSGHYYDQNSVAGLYSLTTAGAADFNRRFSAGVTVTECGSGDELVKGVRYYSWGGTSPAT
ncbi:hypothetical protein NL327_28005, partial [Klebsiella pneumoniae]|nr:hypothetical protein [Klebsiella pneumoniae]